MNSLVLKRTKTLVNWHANLQARTCAQYLTLNPTLIDPNTVGSETVEHRLRPVMTHVAIAPASILQLVHYGCGPTAKSPSILGSHRCSCKVKNI